MYHSAEKKGDWRMPAGKTISLSAGLSYAFYQAQIATSISQRTMKRYLDSSKGLTTSSALISQLFLFRRLPSPDCQSLMASSLLAATALPRKSSSLMSSRA